MPGKQFFRKILNTGSLKKRINILITISIVLSLIFIFYSIRNDGRNIKKELLAQTQLISHVIDTTNLQQLKGDISDTALTAYKNLKSQLSLICSSNPDYRFVYFMGQRADKSVFFFIDSEPETSTDVSPPGQTYTEVGKEIKNAFKEEKATVVGPINDRWGEWITALVPIYDTQTNKFIAFLALDIKAATWRISTFNHSIGTIAISVLLIFLFLLFLYLTVETEKKKIIEKHILIKQSNEWLNALLDSMKDTVFVIDGHGKMVNFFHSKEKEIYPEPQSFVGNKYTAVLTPKLSSFLKEAIHKIERGAESETFDYTVSNNEKTIWFSAVVSKIHGNNLRQSSYLCVVRDISHRKQIEEFLKNREAELHGVFLAAPIGIGKTVNRIIVQVNETVCSMLGYSSSELLMQSARILYPNQETFEYVGTEKYRQIKESGTGSLETQWVHKDGRKIDIFLSSTPVDPSDANKGYIFTALDITARRTADEAIRKSEERYRMLFELSPLPMWVCDIDTQQFLAVNDAALKKYEFTRTDFLTRSRKDIETGECDFKTDRNIVKHKTNNHNNLYVELTSHDIDFSGRKAELLIANDVTETIRTEQLLKEKTEELDRYFTNALDLLCIADMYGNFKRLNPQWEKCLGYKLKEMINQPYLQFVHPDDRAATIEAMTVLSKQNEILNFTNRYRCKDGSYKWIEWRSIPNEDMVYATARDITNKKLAEEKLRLSEQQLRQIIDLVPHFVFAKDIDGKFIMVNKALADNYGTSVEDLLGKTDADFAKSNEEVEHFRKDDLEVIHSGKPKIIPYEVITDSQNKIRILQTVKIPFSVMGNESPAILGVAVDVTEQKMAEDALRKSESKYRLLTENMQDVIWQSSLDAFTYISPSCENLLGYKPEEIVGKSLFDFLTDESKAIVAANIADLLKYLKETGLINNYFFEIQQKHKNGSLVWTEVMSIPIVDEKGQLIGFQGITRDISKRKEDQIHIIQNNERVESLLHLNRIYDNPIDQIFNFVINQIVKLSNSKIGYIATVNSDETEIMVSGFYSQSKQQQESAILSNTITVNENKMWSSVFAKREPIILTEKELNNLSQPVTHDSIKNFLCVPIVINNKIVCIGGVGNKESEYTVSDINQIEVFLEALWNIIERKKSEQLLLEAKNKAEESDRLKSAFLANMSHEIRTPMNGILGFTELLSVPQIEETEKKNYISFINKCGVQLLSIIDDLIDIAKIEANQLHIHNREVNLNEIMNEMFALFETRCNSTKVKLELKKELKDDASYIISDPVRIRQILTNLIGNAVKFTHQGKIRFGYAVKYNYLEFFVEDTGIGIPNDRLNVIFERFRQAEENVSQKYGGTGLGLAISKSLIELLGGEIWVSSEVGNGTKFVFHIPYVPAENVAIEKRKQTPMPKRKITVLIAEDEDSNYYFFEQLFINMNLSLKRAHTGEEALSIVKEDPYIDLILMDIKMPVMNGEKASRLIKKIRPDIPIIVQTAYAQLSEKERILQSGVDYYISKPINRVQLFELIALALNKN